MPFAICTVSAAPLRKEPAHRSEMISQLLFGETMEILEEKEEWLRIKGLHDNYEGWLTHHLVQMITDAIAGKPLNFVATGLLNPVTLPDQLINLSMGSSLTDFDPETRLLWDDKYKYHGTYRNIKQSFDTHLLYKTIHPWMNAPYLWGGRTFMGVDCSGFVQVVFKVLGITLQRDAYLQAEEGAPVDNFEAAATGDAAFFCNENGRITHVGIVLDDNKIIHASGKVRIDRLTQEGIINTETGKRTHDYYSLRRYIHA